MRGPRGAQARSSRIFMRGYIAEMGEHPQTIGYALLDSPVGLAAWMLDHDADSYEKISRAFLDGQPYGRPHPGPRPRQHHAVLADEHRDLVGAAVLGGRTKLDGRAAEQPPPHVSLPVAFTVFPGELFQAPRHWVEEGLPQPHLLQRGRQGRPLRRLGGARAVLRTRCARRSGHCGSRARWGGASPYAPPHRPREVSLGRAASGPRGGSLVLPPRPGWRDLAGRCWHARPPAASTPPTNPAPEPTTVGSLDPWPTSLALSLAPGGLSACHGVHRPPVPRAGQTARPGNRKGQHHDRGQRQLRRQPHRRPRGPLPTVIIRDHELGWSGARIDLAVPGRPIGPWSRRTGAPQASATGRGRAGAQPGRGLPASDRPTCAPVGGSASSGLVQSGFRLVRML